MRGPFQERTDNLSRDDDTGRAACPGGEQPAGLLACPLQGRRFPTVELEGFVVEFRGEGAAIEELIIHQPTGTLIARRLDG